MRKLKLFLSLLMVMLLSVGNVWAADVTTTWTATSGAFGSGIGSGTFNTTVSGSSDTQEWSYARTLSSGVSYTGWTSNCIQLGKNGGVENLTLSTSNIPGTIKSVAVECASYQGKHNVSITVGETAYLASTATSSWTTVGAKSGTGTSSGTITISFTGGTRALYIKSITVVYNEGGAPDPVLESIVISGTPEKGTYEAGEEFDPTGLVATGHYDNSTSADITSSVEWAYTPAGALTQGLTSVNVTATKGTVVGNKDVDITVNAALPKSSLIFTAACNGSGTADDGVEWTVTSDGSESSFDNAKGIHYGTGSVAVQYIRLTTSDIEGTIAKVVVNASTANGVTATVGVTVNGAAFGGDAAQSISASAAEYTFTGSASGEIVVTVTKPSSATKAIYVKSVVVYYTPAAVEVKKPTFTLATGSYLGAQSVEISCATSGAAIYYTLDGNDPTSGSTPYTDAIDINETTTLKAIAILGTTSSAIASATYTIINTEHAGTAEDPYSVADAKAVIDGIGTKENAYVSGIISQVDSYNSTYKSITYWISADGTTSGQQLQVYSGKGIDGADFSSVDDVVAKATVVVKGTLKKHYGTYEFDYNNELVSYSAPVEPVVTLKQSGSTVTVLNLEATSVANQAIDIICDNFGGEITSVSAKLYEESACETEITSGAWVTDITVNGANNQVTFNVVDNAGEARQVWMKVTASDGSNDAFAVLNIKQAKYTVDYAELPFAFDGGRADIATTNGMSQVGLDSDYGSSPKLKFNTTGDNLIIHINEAPGKLTYDIKNNSFADGIFTVQESADGETYTEVASHTEIVGTQNEEVDLKEATRYVKFIYTEKVTGNVGLGNIAISEYVEPEPPVVNYTEVRNGLTEGWYYTMCLDKAVTAVKAGSIWKVLSKAANGNDVILEEVTGTLDAGRPYIFRAAASTLEVAYTGDAVGAPVTEGNNGLVGSFTEEPLAQNPNHYIIYNNALYYVNSDNVKVGAHRAYLNMTGVPAYSNEPQQGAPRRRVTMAVYGEQTATGIDALNATDAPVKVMIDGNIYILRGEKMYDATGRLVK